MLEQFSRTGLLIGESAVQSLMNARVAVFGLGGVGGYVVEALARSGVGEFDLIDNDTVCLSNLNRQIIATHKTIGKSKVDVMKERILDINPDAVVHTHNCFFLPETSGEFRFEDYSYVVDAIDTVSGKIEIIMKAQAAHVPVISSMGTGNKLDPTRLEISDIYKTQVCPLAKVMRRELKNRGVKKLKVVYSQEIPIKQEVDSVTSEDAGNKERKRPVPASIAFVPSVAGLIIAGEVIKDLIKEET
ncbi:MAG: tRNA threonylcarbamoyladenosine dehydratase [Lachnospiraceae bacterium]|nr:tRNA threonylcarbamoyladenosine dehydratase [Lachnospiraceae bacterium]